MTAKLRRWYGFSITVGLSSPCLNPIGASDRNGQSSGERFVRDIAPVSLHNLSKLGVEEKLGIDRVFDCKTSPLTHVLHQVRQVSNETLGQQVWGELSFKHGYISVLFGSNIPFACSGLDVH